MFACAILLSACGTTTEPGSASYTVQIIATHSPTIGAPFAVSPDTIVIEARDGKGNPAIGFSVRTDSTSGWLQPLGSTEWLRSPTLVTDSAGRVRR